MNAKQKGTVMPVYYVDAVVQRENGPSMVRSEFHRLRVRAEHITTAIRLAEDSLKRKFSVTRAALTLDSVERVGQQLAVTERVIEYVKP